MAAPVCHAGRTTVPPTNFQHRDVQCQMSANPTSRISSTFRLARRNMLVLIAAPLIGNAPGTTHSNSSCRLRLVREYKILGSNKILLLCSLICALVMSKSLLCEGYSVVPQARSIVWSRQSSGFVFWAKQYLMCTECRCPSWDHRRLCRALAATRDDLRASSHQATGCKRNSV